VSVDDGPEAQVMRGEVAGWMTTLLGTLSDRQREIVVLRVVVGLSADSGATGSPTAAAREIRL
jgi:RNA polymerase sigma-70 factor (ECF subfamily)